MNNKKSQKTEKKRFLLHPSTPLCGRERRLRTMQDSRIRAVPRQVQLLRHREHSDRRQLPMQHSHDRREAAHRTRRNDRDTCVAAGKQVRKNELERDRQHFAR